MCQRFPKSSRDLSGWKHHVFIKVLTVQCARACKGRCSITTLIFNVTIEKEPRCAPRPMWTVWRREASAVPAGIFENSLFVASLHTVVH
jgi:hypothetical protein